MSLLLSAINVILHLDKYLAVIVVNYGVLTYALIFLIIFFETGLVLMPFLPGDSLLFAAGALAANSSLNLIILLASLSLAAVLGDSFNYFLGRRFGEQLFVQNRWYHPEYVAKTQRFYEKYGSKTIVLARFVPIVRTFAPFVAGIGKMSYGSFLYYNLIGGLAWVFLFILGGYFLGNLALVKENFSLFILLIIFLSFIPVIIELVKHFRRKSYHQKQV